MLSFGGYSNGNFEKLCLPLGLVRNHLCFVSPTYHFLEKGLDTYE